MNKEKQFEKDCLKISKIKKLEVKSEIEDLRTSNKLLISILETLLKQPCK